MSPYTLDETMSDPASSSSVATEADTNEEILVTPIVPTSVIEKETSPNCHDVTSTVLSPIVQDPTMHEYLFPVAYSSSQIQKPIAKEKAAVKRAMALESNFRREKQDIVHAMGGSPAELLTPSADWRLQRKLNNGSPPSIRRSHNHDDSERDTGFGVFDPDAITIDDPPEQLDHSREHAQYFEEEIRSNQGRTLRFKLLVAISVFLMCVGIITMIVVLTTSRSSSVATSTTTSIASHNCQLNAEDMVLCTTGFIQVPDCAQGMYDALVGVFIENTTSVSHNNYGCDAQQFGLVALAVAMTNYERIDDAELYWALATIYFALDGLNWRSGLHWLTGSSPCSEEWYGVACSVHDDLQDDGTISIHLEGNLLRGTLPTQIGRISALISLNFGHNLIEGTLPSEIGSLTNLEVLSLDEVSLSGQIPIEIGRCTQLREINFLQTSFSGSIPTQIGDLKKLGRYFRV
jgi:hypothetical protein